MIKLLFIYWTCPVKNTTVKRLIIRIFAYSAIKIMANNPLLYSVLNPDTSSDSPSAKSNGERFVSAKFVMYHITKIGEIIIITHEYRWDVMMCISIVIMIIRVHNKINVIDTSYEIVWATPRSAPSRAYFEFEHQPDIKVT
jgi:hypothetical protein